MSVLIDQVKNEWGNFIHTHEWQTGTMDTSEQLNKKYCLLYSGSHVGLGKTNQKVFKVPP